MVYFHTWRSKSRSPLSYEESKQAVILIKGVATMGLYSNDFSEVFSKLLDEMGVTCYQLHEYTKLDQAYLSRLRSGEKSNPTPETIMKISLGLVHYSSKLKISDIDKLFKSVGRSLHLYSY